MLSVAQPTCFLIADISGYTGYLADVELDHAQDILADLVGAVVTALRPNFRLAKLEGDAACSVIYNPDGTRRRFIWTPMAARRGSIPVGICSRPVRLGLSPTNVKSTEILAVLCSGDLKQATIFGLATIDGSGEFAYRIDVQDLAEPGVGQDTYRMRIGIYDSGEPGTLLGENVQIHKMQ